MSTPLGRGHSSGGAKFMTVRYGKLSIKANENEPDPDLTVRKDQEGKERYYIEFDYFNGIIDGQIERREFEFNGKKLSFLDIPIAAADEKYRLQLKWLSNPYTYFMSRLENLDLSKPVTFGAFLDDKGFNMLYMKQDGKTVENRYPKNNRGDLPEWEKITYNGEDKWDRTKETDYYLNVLENTNKFFERPIADIPQEQATADAEQDDDLPF